MHVLNLQGKVNTSMINIIVITGYGSGKDGIMDV